MKKLILSFFVVSFVILNFGVGIILAAQPATIATISPGDYGLPDTHTRLSTLINTVLKWIIYIAGVASVVVIIFAGMKYALAGGDERKIEDSKKFLTYAIIGIIIIMCSYIITQIILGIIQNDVQPPDIEEATSIFLS